MHWSASAMMHLWQSCLLKSHLHVLQHAAVFRKALHKAQTQGTTVPDMPKGMIAVLDAGCRATSNTCFFESS